MTRVLVLNGPNLGRLGKREPAIYGTATYADLSDLCRRVGEELGLAVEVRQTDYEGELIKWIHEACDHQLPVVLNPAAFTHYSIAVMDAVKMRTAPLIEVHISNIAGREDFRHMSVITGSATGIIAGFGFQSYVLALHAIAALAQGNTHPLRSLGGTVPPDPPEAPGARPMAEPAVVSDTREQGA